MLLSVVFTLILTLVLKLLILLFAEDEHGADSKGHQRRCLFFPSNIFQFINNLCNTVGFKSLESTLKI